MLVMPSVGFGRSVNAHKVSLEVLCDWIEGSILFGEDDEISTTDVLDYLIDGLVYAEQDFAREMIAHGWKELINRQRWMGIGSSIDVVGSRIVRKADWRTNPAHAFLVALSFKKWYPKWGKIGGQDYTEQGALFEQLTAETLRFIFPNWDIFPTGWSRTHTKKLNHVVSEVAARLGEPTGEISRWTTDSANEAGLDILCHYPLGDGRPGTPVFLVQCASGGQWEDKLRTPDIRIWGRIVTFTGTPKKAFAMPYSLTDRDFVRVCNIVDGMLLDRYRILWPGRTNPDWISALLKADLIKWLEPRVSKLPVDKI